MLNPQQRYADLSPQLTQVAAGIALALQRGQLDAAERDAIAALAQAPDHAEILRLFGVIQQCRGRYSQAIETLQRARAQRPGDVLIHNALAGVYDAINDAGRARETLRQACALDSTFAPCWFNYGWRLFVDGDIDAAVPVLQHAVALAPRDAQARTLLADALNADGKTQLAIEQYRQIIADHPTGAGQAWWSLATLKPMPLSLDDIVTLQRMLEKDSVAESDRINIAFALAMALEHHGDMAQAFETMQTAHALARRSEPYDGHAFGKRVDDILAAFSKSPAGAESAQGEEVIFIVSLPRSGSTLSEQILASHSQVEGAAELPDLAQIILRESDRVGQPFAHWARTHTPAQWRELGQRYLDRTQRWRQQRPRHTDKMPGNWIYVGAIMAMLPNARVVVCRRDPLETCLGCYRYMFRRHPYTHDFSDLASRWRDFDRAVTQWRHRYPDRVREQVYEQLQDDPENQIRELLAYCNLPFEQNCLNFHASSRRVATPSAAQVREPIRRDTARADKYGALLDPLRSALGLAPFTPR